MAERNEMGSNRNLDESASKRPQSVDLNAPFTSVEKLNADNAQPDVQSIYAWSAPLASVDLKTDIESGHSRRFRFSSSNDTRTAHPSILKFARKVSAPNIEGSGTKVAPRDRWRDGICNCLSNL